MEGKQRLTPFKSKLLVKEICDFLKPSEVAKVVALNKELKTMVKSTSLDMFLHVKIVASNFREFSNLCSYIAFLSLQLGRIEPHSFYLCLNTYHLKEDLLTNPLFMKVTAHLIKQLTLHSAQLNSLRLNFIKQQGLEVNEKVCEMVLPLFNVMSKKSKFVKLMWIDSMATEKMIEAICNIETLQELRITHCSYITGEFLKNLKSTQLQRIDFSGSLYIQYEEILHCLARNRETLHKFSIDGETLKSRELNQIVEELHSLTEFNIFFAQKLNDMFVHTLAKKLNFEQLEVLCIRKTVKLSNDAFTSLFSVEMPALFSLNLEDSAQIGDSACKQIGSNCRNLKKLNLSWSPCIKDQGIEYILAGCLKLRKLKIVGLKSITDKCLISTMEVNDCQPQERTAFNSLFLLDMTMCDYPSDRKLEEVKRKHPQIAIFNYYKEEIEI